MSLDPRLFLLTIPSGVCLAITALRWRHHRRQVPLADAAAAVSGVVVAEGDEPVVELVLHLKIPYSSSGMSVRETSRELHVRPFVVRIAGGEVIDVEPTRDVRLHATLGKAKKIEHYTRYTKTARVGPGEHVYLVGKLDDATSPQGRPCSEGGRPRRRISPTVVSIEKIGWTARRAAATDKKWLVRWAILTALGPLSYAIPLVPLFFFGFWIRDMIVAQMWWEKTPYSEWYGSGTTWEDRAEYH